MPEPKSTSTSSTTSASQGEYEVVRDAWQLNVINAHLPFRDATEPFLQALAKAYRQMAMLGPTIIIGDMNAAPTPAN